MKNKLQTLYKFGRKLFQDRPRYIFHHIPKCGGTSIRLALRSWFNTIEDNRNPTWSNEQLIESKKDMNSFERNDCLIGHFDVPFFYLKDRYPKILADDRPFLFTFLRDPLEVKISLYYYELKMKGELKYSLEERLFGSPNYVANRFPCDHGNFKKTLDRYNFIGITERSQESMDHLAKLVDKPKIILAKKNESQREVSTNELSPSLINKFKEINRLDYAIYDYAVNKFDA